MKKKHILYIEDDPIDQLTFKRTILKFNVEYDICTHLKGANKFLKETTYDSIITDYYLTEHNLTNLLNTINPTPFIVLSGLKKLNDQKLLLENGMIAHISKPITLEKMTTIIDLIKNKENTLKEYIEKPNDSYLQEISDNDVSFLKEILEVGIKELPNEIKVIKNAAIQNKKSDLIKNLHKVRTKIALAGMTKLDRKINAIEQGATYSPKEMNDIIDHLELVLNFFENQLEIIR